MIIVGNLEKLYKFPSWGPFIEHCVKSGLARKGPLRDKPDEDGLLMEIVRMPRFDDESSSEDASETEESSSNQSLS